MDKIAFEKIVGYAEVKQELLRILDQLNRPEKYAALGVVEPNGLLLHGVPGIGKSTFAQEFINACDRNTFVCRKDKSNGSFVKEIVRIFEEAQNSAPSIILLDDLDKFANEDEQHRDAEEFVTVQSCIDRVKGSQVFVVATANNIKKLPASLTRAGRFEHVLELKCPKGMEAEDIVKHYLAKKTFVGDIDVRRIARLLAGRSCAELENVVNQAGAYAVYEGRQQVEMTDMIKAILRLIFKAPESFNENSNVLPLVACHEAGHALVAELLEPDSVDLVTVLNHDSNAAGVTSISRDENYFYSKKLMENRVMYLLAGKAATEVSYGVVDPGANSDLHRAFDIVHRFVDDYCSYGFNQFVFDIKPSNEVLERRDSRVASEMENFYSRTKQLIVEHRDKLEAIIARLVQDKILLGNQVQQIMNC